VVGPSVEVEGVDNVQRSLRIFGDAGLKVALKSAHLTAAEVVRDEALPHVPVKTGALKASVRALGAQAKGNVKAGTAKVNHASAIHWGRKVGRVWRGRMAPSPIQARPFLHDALQRKKPEIEAAFLKDVDQMLETVRAKNT
jgi:hypothetical protein